MFRLFVLGFLLILIVSCVLVLGPTRQSAVHQTPSAAGADSPHPGANNSNDSDDELLNRMGVGTNGSDLIAFLNKRSPANADEDHVKHWLDQLGDEQFQKRQDAFENILAVGYSALPILGTAKTTGDPEIAQSVDRLVKEIEKPTYWGVPAAVVRKLIRTRPPGSAEALLRYLPFAATDQDVENIWYGIERIALDAPTVNASLEQALDDPSSARRELAACLLGRIGNDKVKNQVRHLLLDPSPMVRLRAAQGLLASGEKDVIPTLAALLMEPRAVISWQAEELLHWVAGELAPDKYLGDCSLLNRTNCRDAWERWYTKNGGDLDLLDKQHRLRHPLLVLMSEKQREQNIGTLEQLDSNRFHRRSSQTLIWLTGWNGRPRWKLAIPTPARLLELLPNNRVLVVEEGQNYNATITERELSGPIAWQPQIPAMRFVGCQRLPDGSTFLATEFSNRFIRIRSDGTTNSLDFHPGGNDLAPLTFTEILGNNHVFCGAALHRGQLVVGEFDLDSGQLTRRFPDGYPLVNVRPFGNHRFIADAYRLIQDSADGKSPTATLNSPSTQGFRLADNSLLLVVSEAPVDRAVEITNDGRVVWEGFPLTWSSIPGTLLDVRGCLNLVRFGFAQRLLPDVSLQTLANRINSLTDPDVTVRRRAACLLDHLVSPRTSSVIPAIVHALGDEDKEVRKQVYSVLLKIGSSAKPALLESLHDPNGHLRSAAIQALGDSAFGLTQRDVPTLVQALDDPKASVKERAAWGLRSFGAAASEATGLLTKALEDKRRDEDSQQRVCDSAIETLRSIGPAARPAVPKLLAALKGKDSDLANGAALALAQIAPGDNDVIHGLADCLQDKTPTGRVGSAARSLGSMGISAKLAIPALLRRLDEPDPLHILRENDYDSIVEAVASIDPRLPDVQETLAKVLTNKTLPRSARRTAAQCLQKCGADAQRFIPVLKQLLRESDDELSVSLREAIEAIMISK